MRLIELMDELFTHIKFSNEHKSNYQQFQIMSGMVHGVYNKDEVIRCISALTHDLGYPLKKIEKINKSIKKVLPFFSINDFNDFSFEYNNIQQEFAKKFVDFISRQVNINLGFKENDKKTLELFTKIVVTNEYGNVIHIDHDAITSLTKEEHEAILSAFSYEHSFTSPLSTQFGFWNDFEDYRHGIMSAFLLCKNVRAFQDIDYDVIRDDFRYRNTAELETLMAINQILTSISNHTSEQFKITSLTPNTFLTFIDELEEFSRISRASQNREYIEEFCDTALYMEDGWLNIDFEFNNENLDNLDPEISFKGRCKRFLSLFDVRNLSPNLKLRVRCIGKLPTDQNTYCLEIARNHADVLINGESMNIPKYLKANQFYTKEEYANNSHSA